MSVVLYDPENEVPMVCADLEEDRQMDGLVYSVDEQLVNFVPAVSFVALTRDETGNTELAMRVANLQDNALYTAEVHSLPCVSSNGGPVYMRDFGCVGNVGTVGCEPDAASNVIRLPMTVNSITGVSDVSRTYPGVARADAQSVHLKDCRLADGTPDVSGVCPGGRPTLMCIDLLNEIPQIASSSTTAAQNRVTTEQAETTTTASPQVAPTTAAPTTATPTTAAPSTAAPTTDAPTTEAPTTGAPTTTAPSTAAPTAVEDEGSGSGPIDRVGEDDDASSSARGSSSSAKKGPSVDDAVNNDCPNLEFHYDTAVAKGKKRAHEVVQLDVLPGDNCCLASFPPQGLTAFYWQTQHRGRSAAFTVVAGVAGAVVVVAAVGLMAYRRLRSKSSYVMLQDDPADEDGYSVPR